MSFEKHTADGGMKGRTVTGGGVYSGDSRSGDASEGQSSYKNGVSNGSSGLGQSTGGSSAMAGGKNAKELMGEVGESAGIAEADAEQAVLEGASGGRRNAAGLAAATASAQADEAHFSLQQLQTGKTGDLPGVQIAHKERYLSDRDFQTCFGMSKEAFAGLPSWQQQSMKKKNNLF